jgi:hypothetical protein
VLALGTVELVAAAPVQAAAPAVTAPAVSSSKDLPALPFAS